MLTTAEGMVFFRSHPKLQPWEPVVQAWTFHSTYLLWFWQLILNLHDLFAFCLCQKGSAGVSKQHLKCISSPLGHFSLWVIWIKGKKRAPVGSSRLSLCHLTDHFETSAPVSRPQTPHLVYFPMLPSLRPSPSCALALPMAKFFPIKRDHPWPCHIR